MRLPALRTVVLALAVVNAVVIVLIALGIAYLIGSFWWAVPIGAVLLLLGIPPVFVIEYEVQRVIRRRKAKTFRSQGQGHGMAFGSADRETLA